MTAMTARNCETMMLIMIVTTIVISHRIMWGTTPATIGILIETATATITTAGPAEYSTVATDFTAEINSFPANLTHNPVTLVSRKLFWRQFHFYPLRRK